jgi:hypothetical protein
MAPTLTFWGRKDNTARFLNKSTSVVSLPTSSDPEILHAEFRDIYCGIRSYLECCSAFIKDTFAANQGRPERLEPHRNQWFGLPP